MDAGTEDLMRMADKALYAAKAPAQDRVLMAQAIRQLRLAS